MLKKIKALLSTTKAMPFLVLFGFYSLFLYKKNQNKKMCMLKNMNFDSNKLQQKELDKLLNFAVRFEGTRSIHFLRLNT